MGLDV